MIKKNDWFKIREVRNCFSKGRSELTGKSGSEKDPLVAHHVWRAEYGLTGFRYLGRNGNGSNDSGRLFYTIWDAQIRTETEEVDLHFLFHGGNNQHSLDLHEENNYRLFLMLRKQVEEQNFNRRFGPGTRAEIQRWIDFYPDWFREFKKQRKDLKDRDLAISHQGYKLQKRQKKSGPWWCWYEFFMVRRVRI